MTAEIIMLKDYCKAKPAPVAARPLILPHGFTLDGSTLAHVNDEPFHFTSPVRPDQPITEFTDEELCELSDYIFGKVMGEP